MECPRCHEPAPAAALACGTCCAPLRLREEPPPASLDRPLELDRRRRRGAAAPARPPAARGGGEGTAGAPDLSLALERDAASHPHPLPALRRAGAERPRPLGLDADLDGDPDGGAGALSAAPAPEDGALVPAPLGARALAALVDGLLVASATAPPVLLGAWSLPGGVDVAALAPAALVLAALVAVAYASLGLGLAGATLGQRLAGLAVTDGGGQAPTMGRAALRAALAVLGTAALGAGLWPALFTESRQTLHDRVAGTFVVRAP